MADPLVSDVDFQLFVARELGRKSILIELNPAYAPLILKRTQQQSLLAGDAA